jgi:hypothetical protein
MFKNCYFIGGSNLAESLLLFATKNMSHALDDAPSHNKKLERFFFTKMSIRKSVEKLPYEMWK